MSADMEKQYDCIYRYCYRKLQDRQAAEDVTQETFLSFLENGTYREMGRELAYLYTIAGNKCTDYYRKKKLLPLPPQLLAENKEMAKEPGEGEDMAERLAVKSTLREALQALTEDEQELIFLRYVNEVPVGAIAKITGQSRFAVHRSLKKILKKLETVLRKGEGF